MIELILTVWLEVREDLPPSMYLEDRAELRTDAVLYGRGPWDCTEWTMRMCARLKQEGVPCEWVETPDHVYPVSHIDGIVVSLDQDGIKFY